MKTIAVIGATGMLGQPVTEELLGAGFRVKVLARNPEKAASLFGNRVEILVGDIRNEENLARLLDGCEGLYLNLSINPRSKSTDWLPEREGLAGILQAAKRSRIQRVGYISSLVQRYQGMANFRWWAFEIKQHAIQSIKNSGIPYTIFYPSSFMENFDRGNFVRGNKLTVVSGSKHPMWYIAGRDYGKQVARAFQLDIAANRDYPVQGLEAFTNEEAARVFAANYTKRKLTVSTVPFGLIKFLGVFSGQMNYIAHIIEAINNYPEQFESETTWKELGKPTLTLAEYARTATLS